MLNANFLKRVVNGFGRRPEIAEGLFELRERVPEIPEFPLRGRRHERLELLKSVAGRVIEILLAQHAMRSVLHDRKWLTGISALLREPARRFPKGGPHFGTSSSQHAGGEGRLTEPSGFFALTVAFRS